jgi:hypothetical protein
VGFVDRLERALAMDGGLIGTDRVEAQVVLAAIELHSSLVEMFDD